MIRNGFGAGVFALLLSAAQGAGMQLDTLSDVSMSVDSAYETHNIGLFPCGSVWESYCSESHGIGLHRIGHCRGCSGVCRSSCAATRQKPCCTPGDSAALDEQVIKPSRGEAPPQSQPRVQPEGGVPRNPTPPPPSAARRLPGSEGSTRPPDARRFAVHRALFVPSASASLRPAAHATAPIPSDQQGLKRLKQQLRQSWAH
jgi:hypothetical protein